MKTKNYVWIGVAAVLFIALVWLVLPSNADPVLEGKQAVEYKSMSCGCCGTYGQYMGSKGVDVEMINSDDNTAIKDQYGIPEELRSCHTVIIDGYFVEGHVPAEAIAKMLTEKPDIKGIAIAGMPMGSPGMPGAKEGPFIVYAVNKDGSTYEFMKI